jgi:hypothetical protein
MSFGRPVNDRQLHINMPAELEKAVKTAAYSRHLDVSSCVRLVLSERTGFGSTDSPFAAVRRAAVGS